MGAHTNRATANDRHPAYDNLRRAVEALATDARPIQARLQAAEPFFHQVRDLDLRSDPERHLNLRIGAHLIADAPATGGEDDEEADEAARAAWIAALSDAQAADVASDLFKLYELVAGLRDPADEWPNKRY
jgi:hypothetical protein